MAIYDLGTASLAANGEVTGVGTTWKAPLTLIRVGATIVFKTEPVQIYTISEIISDTNVTVYNPDSETVPAGTGYAILAHDGITVQGLAQDVAETLRYYQSRETEVADAVDAFNNFDIDAFQQNVTNVNNQSQQVAQDAAQVSMDMASSEASASSALSSSNLANDYASQAEQAAQSVSGALIGSFQDGVTLNSKTQQILNIGDGYAESYVWAGSLPKVVEENSTPESSGGISPNGWVLVSKRKTGDCVKVTDFTPAGVSKIGVGNADDDSSAIIAALNSGAKSVDFCGLSYTINTWFIPQSGQRLISNGCSITQTVFGFPVFEQRYPNLTLEGAWYANFNGDRNQILTTNSLGYSYVTEGDWKSYSCFLWQNYYQSRDVSGLICGDVYVRNFISGIWLTGPNASIGKCFFYNIDFGVFGVVRDNQKIESIYHSNITSTQLHEGHSLYMNGTGYGLKCGVIYVSGSPQYGSPVKIGGGARNFRIDGIFGHGLANIAYFRDSSYGSVGEIDCELTLNANFTGPDQDPTNYAILVHGATADVSFNGGVRVKANQSGSVKVSFIQVTGGVARFNCSIDYQNSNTSDAQPSFLFTTGGGRAYLNGASFISYANSNSTNYIFNLLGDSGTEILTPPRISLASGAYPRILRYTSNGTGAVAAWKISYDTGLISPPPKGDSIISTLNDYWGVYFSGNGASSIADAVGTQPVVTGAATYNASNTAATNLGRLRYGSQGQEVTIFNVGRFTALIHNAAAGTDGNINISGGANIPAANWFCAKLIKKGSEFFVVSIYP